MAHAITDKILLSSSTPDKVKGKMAYQRISHSTPQLKGYKVALRKTSRDSFEKKFTPGIPRAHYSRKPVNKACSWTNSVMDAIYFFTKGKRF